MVSASEHRRPSALLRVAALSIACAALVSVCHIAPRQEARSATAATPDPRDRAAPRSLVVTGGRQFYAAPDGRPSGTGDAGSPWDLKTALSQPAIQPGDTLWLRGGTYVGIFTSALAGTDAAPIRVQQFPGERATLDGGTTPPSYQAEILRINGAYTWYIGFEVTNSNTTRVSSSAASNPPDQRAVGVAAYGPGTRLINLIIHDTGQGIGLWTPATDSEAYGNLIYYNGWDAPDRGHGHGIYTQNQAPSVKRIVDNILFDQFAIGIQAYTEGGNIDNILLQGNTAFENGALSRVSGYTYNLLIGGLKPAANPSMVSNFTYTPPAAGGNNNLGYSAGCTNAIVTGNYFVGDSALKLVACDSGLAMSSNTFYGGLSGFAIGDYPNNTVLSARPGSAQVFVRPNQYESGRASVTVFNWAHADSVAADVSGVLSRGDRYEIRSARNFFGQAVSAGIYAGGSVSIPLTALTAAAPIGVTLPTPGASDFQVFVLRTLVPARANPEPAPTPAGAPRAMTPR